MFTKDPLFSKRTEDSDDDNTLVNIIHGRHFRRQDMSMSMSTLAAPAPVGRGRGPLVHYASPHAVRSLSSTLANYAYGHDIFGDLSLPLPLKRHHHRFKGNWLRYMARCNRAVVPWSRLLS